MTLFVEIGTVVGVHDPGALPLGRFVDGRALEDHVAVAMADDHAIEEAGPDGGGAGGCEATPEDRTSDAWDCVGSDETVGMTFEKLHADDETDSDEDGQDFDDAVGAALADGQGSLVD